MNTTLIWTTLSTIVIAEKPSVAKSIAAVLGAGKRENGYVEGNGYLVSWCFGHLAEFASADVYDAKYEKWNYADLPIVPDPWEYAVSRDKAQQFNLLKSLMSRGDVSEVINACDAGREGEAIFRTVYNLSGCKKPMNTVRCFLSMCRMTKKKNTGLKTTVPVSVKLRLPCTKKNSESC